MKRIRKRVISEILFSKNLCCIIELLPPTNISINTKWVQTGTIVADGQGKGNYLKRLYERRVVVDDKKNYRV